MVRAVAKARQKPMIRFAQQMARGGRDNIKVGPNHADRYGRRLNLDPANYSGLIRGTKLTSQVDALLDKIQNNQEYRLKIQAHFAGYDIRTDETDPAIWVLTALAYATSLVNRTGRKTGHKINLSVDNWQKHYEAMSIIAYTLIKTGLCRNGGGITYLGVVDGGTAKNNSMYERAATGKDGNWIYFTMSHRKEIDFRGAKFGMDGKVLCTENLMEHLWNVLLKGKYLPLVAVSNPHDYLVTVSEDTSHRVQIADDMGRARTGLDRPTDQWLAGKKITYDAFGSPLGERVLHLFDALGADILVRNPLIREDFSADHIADPNEPKSKKVLALMDLARETGREVPFGDPDQDRTGLISLNSRGEAVNLDGTALNILAIQNLATHNPNRLPMRAVYDARAAITIHMLGQRLAASGNSIELFVSEPGYSNIHEVMAQYNAQLGAEQTGHVFITPYTSRAWGASRDYKNVQGGDDSGLVLANLLTLSAQMWEGRTAAQQLEFILDKYQIPPTAWIEKKPQLAEGWGMAKYAIADQMRTIASDIFGNSDAFEVTLMKSGVRVFNKNANVAFLIRHSNSGSGFTVSVEHLEENSQAGATMLNIAAALTAEAIKNAKIELAAQGDPLKDFIFEERDIAPYIGKLTLADVRQYAAAYKNK